MNIYIVEMRCIKWKSRNKMCLRTMKVTQSHLFDDQFWHWKKFVFRQLSRYRCICRIQWTKFNWWKNSFWEGTTQQWLTPLIFHKVWCSAPESCFGKLFLSGILLYFNNLNGESNNNLHYPLLNHRQWLTVSIHLLSPCALYPAGLWMMGWLHLHRLQVCGVPWLASLSVDFY